MVRPGETLHQELSSGFEPIPIKAIVARAGGSCLTGAQLGEDPGLDALWSEALQGIALRRAFALQYRFSRELRQDIRVGRRLFRDADEVRVDTLHAEPDSAAAREQRRRLARAAEGFGRRGGLALGLPDERDLSDEGFLDAYCLETAVEEADGAVGLRFRPVRPRPDHIDIRGTLWIDADSNLIRRLDVDWIEGERRIAWGSIDYGDVVVNGSAFRLPRSGYLAGRPSGMLAAVVTGATARLTYTYWGFREVAAANGVNGVR